MSRLALKQQEFSSTGRGSLAESMLLRSSVMSGAVKKDADSGVRDTQRALIQYRNHLNENSSVEQPFSLAGL